MGTITGGGGGGVVGSGSLKVDSTAPVVTGVGIDKSGSGIGVVSGAGGVDDAVAVVKSAEAVVLVSAGFGGGFSSKVEASGDSDVMTYSPTEMISSLSVRFA